VIGSILAFFSAGFITFYVFYSIIDRTERKFWIYILGSWSIFSAFVYSTISVTIVILFLKIYQKIQKNEKELQSLTNLKRKGKIFGMKFTFFVFILNFNTFFWCGFILMTAIQYLFGRDVFGIFSLISEYLQELDSLF
jgi:hypothetical protein